MLTFQPNFRCVFISAFWRN